MSNPLRAIRPLVPSPTRFHHAGPSLLAGALIALLACAPARDAAAETVGFPAARLDSLRACVEGLVAFGFTGQIVLAADDSILVERAAGDADASGRRVGPHTRFALGSVTKSLTGALIVREVDRGVLDLDQPLSRYLEGVPPDKAGITLRHLLTHTSGLPMDAESEAEDDSRDEVVRKILAEPLLSAPGEKFHYSNAGFQLLAAVLERVTGQPFARLVRDSIFTPCGMTDTGTGPSGARATRDLADGRNEWRFISSMRTWKQRWAGTGAGDLVSTAHDLWRWAHALQRTDLLSKRERDMLFSRREPLPTGSFYGFGLYVIPQQGAPDLISIGGDVPGYHSSVIFEREAPWRASSVVMTGERFGRRLELNAIQNRLWRVLTGRPAPMPPATQTWPTDRLKLLAGGWSLPGGDGLELTLDGEGLRLGLSGAGAMDLVYGDDSLGTRALLDGRARDVLEGAAASDSALAAALHPVEMDLWGKTLREGFENARKGRGPFLGVLVDGTVPLPWLAKGTRTYARLRFARGDADVSLAWLEGALLDVAFGEGRPHPVLLPVAPLAEGGLAAWDVLSGTTIRLEPFQDESGTGMLVIGPYGSTIARREGG